MFQKIRLMRTKWPNAQTLAEELYAMLNDDIPVSTNAPMTINNPTPAAPLTINQTSGDLPSIVFKKNGQPAGSLGFDPKTGQPQLKDKNGNPATGQGTISSPPPQTVFLGQIIGGSGDTYTANLYRQGKGVGPVLNPDGSSLVATVKVAEIAGAETIPAGRWFLVDYLGPVVADSQGQLSVQSGQYWLQAPIWELSP